MQHHLETLGGHLIISDQSASSTIPHLINEFDVTDIYAEEEYASEELTVIEDLKNELPPLISTFSGEKLCIIEMTFHFKSKTFP